MAARPLVLIPSDEPAPGPEAAARVLGARAEVATLPSSGPERAALLSRAEVLLVFAWRIRLEELASLARLRFVQSVWAGVDRIPVARLAAACPGVQVANGSGPNAAQVAEHALGLYLDCAKRITWRDRTMRSGGWPQEAPAAVVAGSRIAVVGWGAIGRRVGRALRALDADVVAVNRTGRAEDAAHAVDLEGLVDLLPTLDGVVLSLPLTRRTEGLVDRAFLEALPPRAVLVNVARGRLIVQADLFRHLETHPDFHAGLDTWWRYPKGQGAVQQDLPFHELDNVVMTPHSAFQADGTRDVMVESAAANVARFLSGEAVRNLEPLEEY